MLGQDPDSEGSPPAVGEPLQQQRVCPSAETQSQDHSQKHGYVLCAGLSSAPEKSAGFPAAGSPRAGGWERSLGEPSVRGL